MKQPFALFLGLIFLLIHTYALAGCGECQGSYCNPFETSCQCTDPTCNMPWQTNCISRAECCEAFGNIGAR